MKWFQQVPQDALPLPTLVGVLAEHVIFRCRKYYIYPNIRQNFFLIHHLKNCRVTFYLHTKLKVSCTCIFLITEVCGVELSYIWVDMVYEIIQCPVVRKEWDFFICAKRLASPLRKILPLIRFSCPFQLF